MRFQHHLGARLGSRLQQQMIEPITAEGHGQSSVGALVPWLRIDRRAKPGAGWQHERNAADGYGNFVDCRGNPQRFQNGPGSRAEIFATNFLARERRSIEQGHALAGARQQRRQGRSGRARADNDHVVPVWHPRAFRLIY